MASTASAGASASSSDTTAVVATPSGAPAGARAEAGPSQSIERQQAPSETPPIRPTALFQSPGSKKLAKRGVHEPIRGTSAVITEISKELRPRSWYDMHKYLTSEAFQRAMQKIGIPAQPAFAFQGRTRGDNSTYYVHYEEPQDDGSVIVCQPVWQVLFKDQSQNKPTAGRVCNAQRIKDGIFQFIEEYRVEPIFDLNINQLNNLFLCANHLGANPDFPKHVPLDTANNMRYGARSKKRKEREGDGDDDVAASRRGEPSIAQDDPLRVIGAKVLQALNLEEAEQIPDDFYKHLKSLYAMNLFSDFSIMKLYRLKSEQFFGRSKSFSRKTPVERSKFVNKMLGVRMFNSLFKNADLTKDVIAQLREYAEQAETEEVKNAGNWLIEASEAFLEKAKEYKEAVAKQTQDNQQTEG